MSSTGDVLPLTSGAPATDDQWKQWAVSVFGGNEARATAAAHAAALARSAGASSDELFAAARAAYDNPGPGATAAAIAGAHDAVIRPSGRRILAFILVGILVASVPAVIARVGSGGAVLVIGAAAVIFIVWYALSIRSNVRVNGATITVQGVLHRRVFQVLDVRQITVQPRATELGARNGPLRGQFLASFIGSDFSHLFELRQGAWTRTDIDKIGAALGVQVVDDSETSVT
jgi:hypothetical protein